MHAAAVDEAEEHGDDADADAATTQANATLTCNNCRIRPITTIPILYSDWCSLCDESLYLSQFIENVEGSGASTDEDVKTDDDV